MNIVFDSQIFQSQKYGGVSRYFVELARQLPLRSGDSVKTAVLAPFYINQYLREHRDELRVVGTYVERMRGIRHLNAVLSALLAPGWRADILHETYYCERPLQGIATKRVLTVYDMIHECFPDSFSNAAQVQQRKRAAVRRADHIICISHHTKYDLVRLLDVDPEKVTVVHLGSPDHQPEPMGNPVLSTPFLLFVGQRKGYKNFEGFLKGYAASKLLRKTVSVIAFGGGAFTAQEQELIRSLGIATEMVLQLSGTDQLLYQLYRQALAFVYPSLYEGFGIPPLEAMSFSCPVICSQTSSIPEVVGQAAVYVQPDDPDSIKDALDMVCEDAGLRQSLITKGLERITHFSWQKCAEETAAVYQQLLQE